MKVTNVMNGSMKGIRCMLAVIAGLITATAAADTRELAFQVALPTKAAPKVDGVLDDACWKDAPVHSDYYQYMCPDPRRVTNTKTDCMIVYDAKGVYTGIRNWEDHPEKLIQKTTKDFQLDIWRDDCGEIYFDPEAAGIGFYKFVVNSLGKYDTVWRMDTANMSEDWTTAGVACAAKVTKDRWEVELFVPWSAFHDRPAPKAGDVWTFCHSRFRWGAVGGWAGLSSSAPGGSGVSPNKFGYLYFSDGSCPDAANVLAILEKRLNTDWGIAIGGKAYLHDADGTRSCDLDAEQKGLVDGFTAFAAGIEPRLSTLADGKMTANYEKLRAACTNEIAKFDRSFASVMSLREALTKLREVEYEVAGAELVRGKAEAAPVALPLAGRYDLNPPTKYNGHNGWHRHNVVRDAFATPHLDWCGKLLGGRARVLFMTGFGGELRDMVELEQRYGIDASYFPGNFGSTGIYEDPLSHGTYLDKQAQFETLLAKNPQAVVFNVFRWTQVPARYRYEILRRVRDEGMGLALLTDTYQPNSIPYDFKQRFEGDGAARKTLARLVPYAQLPGATPPYGQKRDERPTEAEVRCWRFGKGRVVSCSCSAPGVWSLQWKAAYETRGAFLMNAIRWAAGEDPAAAVTFGVSREREEFPADMPFLAYEVDTRESAVNRVRCRLRTAENEIVKDEIRELSSGRNLLSVDLRELRAGDYYFDVIPERKGLFGEAAADLAAVYPFSKASSVGKLVIATTNRTVIAEGSKACLPVAWDVGLPEDGQLDWKLFDTYGQLRKLGTKPVKKGAKVGYVEFDGANFPTLSGVLRVTLRDASGAETVRGSKLLFFPNHRFPDYTMILWGNFAEYNLAELYAPRCMDEFGYDCHLGEDGWLSAAFNGRAVPHLAFVNLRPGPSGTTWYGFPTPVSTNKAHAAELKELQKDLCCYRPAVRKAFEEGFSRYIRKCAPYGVSVYNLGDECGYSDDIGFGDAADDGYFFDFLKRRYGTIERYNAAHKTALGDFAEVKRLKTEEAQKAGDWPAWFDQVSYAAQMYSDTFQMCRDVILKFDRKARVGAEGSASGNLDVTVKNLEFWGPYGNVVMDEVLRSIAPDRVRGMWWGGYLRTARDGFPCRQWEFLLTGRANADQWFSAQPGQTEGAFAGDFSFYPYVEVMRKNHAQLKRGLASFLIQTPLRRDPFAIYYSWASCRAATLSDEFQAPMLGCNELVQFCYRHGFDSSFVTPGSLANLADRKLLFLPGVCSLGDAEVTALKAFVKRGGKIYADCEPGVLDGFLARRAEPPLKGLWTKYERGASDEQLSEIVAAVGSRQTEFLNGPEWSRTVLRTRVLGDMKCVGFSCRAVNCGKPVTVGFGRRGHIYEVDVGYIGCDEKVEIPSLERPFKLYAQFTEEQKPPVVELDRTELPAGEFVSLLTDRLRQGSVYRLEVEDPDGKRIANREQVVKADAKAQPKIRFQFPYSDRSGSYKVILRDIATGLVGSLDVAVK